MMGNGRPRGGKSRDATILMAGIRVFGFACLSRASVLCGPTMFAQTASIFRVDDAMRHSDTISSGRGMISVCLRTRGACCCSIAGGAIAPGRRERNTVVERGSCEDTWSPACSHTTCCELLVAGAFIGGLVDLLQPTLQSIVEGVVPRHASQDDSTRTPTAVVDRLRIDLLAELPVVQERSRSRVRRSPSITTHRMRTTGQSRRVWHLRKSDEGARRCRSSAWSSSESEGLGEGASAAAGVSGRVSPHPVGGTRSTP